MTTHWFSLIIHLLLGSFCLYVWKRYRDKNYLWVSLLNALSLIVDFWNLYFKNRVQLSEAGARISNTLLLIFWVVSFSLTVYILFRGPKRNK